MEILIAGAAVAGIICAIPILNRWIKRMRTPPDFPCNQEYARTIDLEGFVRSRGRRLFWGDARQLHAYIHSGDYERIVWVDKKTKKWLLAPIEGSHTIPLWTQKTYEEIVKDREKRAKQSETA